MASQRILISDGQGGKEESNGQQDVEVQVMKQPVGENSGLQRQLKSRHLQMIAIGGAVGTGLFIGSAGALAKAGPVSCLLAYLFVGSLLYSVMVSLGEMATFIPVSGAFTAYANRFVDPSLAFAMGWTYWLSWSISYALELTAAGMIVQYWDKSLNIGIFIGAFWVIFTLMNLLPVSLYGEFEFWFAGIKVFTILGFMVFAICVDVGVGQQGYLGFRYWVDPGPFAPYLIDSTGSAAKFVGFWAVLIQAAFSYQGAELVGIGAGEAVNPRKSVPMAIRKTFYRILFLFCFTVFFIGLLVPYDCPDLLSDAEDATASPFVIAAKLAGIKVLPGLINAVLLTAVLSAANSDTYCGSRIVVGLCQEGFAPKFFSKASKRGVPYNSVGLTAAVGLLGFLNLSEDGTNAFNWLLNITTVAGLISWACINLCHIYFMRALSARNIPRTTLPYQAPGQPYLAYYGLCVTVLVILTQGFTAFIPWNIREFFVAYVSLILFIVMFAVHKLVYRTNVVESLDADLDTGRKEVDAMVFEDEEGKEAPRNWLAKAWKWL